MNVSSPAYPVCLFKSVRMGWNYFWRTIISDVYSYLEWKIDLSLNPIHVISKSGYGWNEYDNWQFADIQDN